MRGDMRSRERLMAVLKDEREFINSSQGNYNDNQMNIESYVDLPQKREDSPIEIKYHDQ